ncbi:MAG TPA: hypothetical protein VGD10_04525 [Allosphingosinicella sp.]|uniref:hypothetical protein n=1 Tax=Allosphingosinicella sp. TaxID=2823234 RepID=UPI002ED8D9A0
MNRQGPHDQPSQVIAESGEVQMDGPDGIAAALTPEAAEETGRRLLEAATEARRQLGEAWP